VKLNKTQYLELEPIIARLEVKNTSEVAQAIMPPNFFQLQMEVMGAGDETAGRFSTSFISVKRVGLPRKLEPGDTIKEDVMIITNLGKMFPTHGNYRIRYILPIGSEELKSEPMAIEIMRAAGVDAEALTSLRTHQSKSRAPDELFRWMDSEGGANQETASRTFVDKYKTSVYGEYAILKLGNVYLSKGYLDRAKGVLERLRGSENDVIINEMDKSLAEITRRKADLQKQENLKPM